MSPSDSRFEPIQEQCQPIGAEKIRELEAKLHAPLPKEYIAFISYYGGCGFSGDASVIVGGRKMPIFSFFDDQKLLSKLEVYTDLTAESKFSFADDMAGNPYVLDALTGKVFFIDFCVSPPAGTKVAPSFDEFLISIDVQPFAQSD